MRTGSVGINATLPDEVGTFARLWSLEPVNGTPIRFTDCDAAVTFEGNVYSNEVGFSASSVMSAMNSVSQGADISTTIGGEITEERIRAGYFDKAVCHLICVDYENPADGGIKLFGGTVGEIKYDDLGKVEIHTIGLFSSRVYINIESYSKFCRAELGDSRCLFDIESMVGSFTVDTVTNAHKFTTLELSEDDQYWQYGVLKFTSGFNNGVVMTVGASQSSDKSITLFVPSPFTIVAGDVGTIYPGCNKTITQCFDRFNNIIHFRGEPFSPRLSTGV